MTTSENEQPTTELSKEDAFYLAQRGERTSRGGLHMYYHRPQNGEVTFSAAWETEYLSRLRSGFIPLPQYGTFVLTERPGDRWVPNKDPWRQILERGGIKEFPLHQILELGWHLTPPKVNGKPIEIPQLKGKTIPDYICPFCFRPERHFYAERLLNSHMTVMHKEQAGQMRAAQQLEKALQAASNPEAMRILADAIRELKDVNIPKSPKVRSPKVKRPPVNRTPYIGGQKE